MPTLAGDSSGGVYTFDYETTAGGISGRLAKITYPGGGYTTYSYGTTKINCTDELTVPILTRATTDTTSGVSGSWQYTNSGITGTAYNQTVSIAGPLSYTETDQFSNAFPTERTIGGITDAYACYNGVATKSACVTPSTMLSPTVSQLDAYVSDANGAANTYNHTQTTYAYPGEKALTVVKWNLPGDNMLTDALSATTVTYTTPKGSMLVPSTVQVTNPADGSTKSYQHNYWDSNGHLYEPCSWVSGSLTGQGFICTIYTFNGNGTINTSYHLSSAGGTTSTFHYSGVCNSLVPTSITNDKITNLTSSVSFGNDPACNGGKPTAQTPVSGYSSSQTYADPLWRMDSHTDESGTVVGTNYRLDSITTTTPNPSGTGNITTYSILDSLGRPYLHQVYNGSTYDTVLTKYDAMGRAYFVSAPFICTAQDYRTCTSTTGTTTQWDAAGRVFTVKDANTGTTTHTYTVTSTHGLIDQSVLSPTPTGDQSTNGKQRAMQYNGLGQLISVCEVNVYSDAGSCGFGIAGQNGYLTTYNYDAAGRLVGVTQGGTTQTRQFSFDGLGRLISETNPESGNTQYYFDGDTTDCGSTSSSAGDLAAKKVANTKITCYFYDALHRLVQRTSTDGVSKNSNFTWDSATVNSVAVGQKGKIAEAWTCPASSKLCAGSHVTDEGFTYDSRGNPNWVYQQSPNSNGWRSVNVLYDDIGNVSFVGGIPGVPNITIGAYDAEGRPTQIDANSGLSPIASAVAYGYFGPLSVTYGSGDFDTFSYDNLGHMTSYKFNVGSQYYQGQPQWNANGTLQSLLTFENITGGNNQANATINYNYDDLGRVWKAAGGALSQTYAYDRYGNLETTGAPASWIPPYGTGYDPSTNRYVTGGTCNGIGICYDADGNLLSDTFNTYTWDGEDQLTSINGTPIVRDAFNRVVESSAWGPNHPTYEKIASPFGAVWLSGSRLAWARIPLPGGGDYVYYNSGTTTGSWFDHADWLGGFRLTTSPTQTLNDQTEYSPFGTPYDQSAGSGCCVYAFGGNIMDMAPGLYDTPNRELHNVQGRWNQPDPSGRRAADLANPQTWNRYAYVLNNPLSYNDPTGLACVNGKDDGRDGDTCAQVAAADAEYQKQHQASATVTAQIPSSWWESFSVGVTALVKTFQTYIKTNPNTDTKYSGRTRGTATPEQNVAARDRNHHMNEEGFGPAQLDKSSTNADAIRGREQQLIEENGGAQSEDGTSGNAINGISRTNPNREAFMGAAESEFGQAPETLLGDHSLEPVGMYPPGMSCGPFGDGPCE
jgi:RHS repeat-associated protein